MFEAIDEAYALPFSTSEEYLQETAEAFNKLTDGLLPGCVGALDGLAVKIEKPRGKDVPNSMQYFNRKS